MSIFVEEMYIEIHLGLVKIVNNFAMRIYKGSVLSIESLIILSDGSHRRSRNF
jgi:hypothetical protein